MLSKGGTLLEIGEANWYGDCEPDFSIGGFTKCSEASIPCTTCGNPSVVYRPADAYDNEYLCEGHYRASVPSANLFSIAKDLYADLFAPSEIVSIDMHGTPQALKFDLNQPLSLDRQFDVVMNHGTAEHIFNVGQVFKTMHDRCEINGLMIHDAPFTGWVDHGFYCFQPTLFYDLAMANCYEVAYVAAYEIKSGLTVRIDSRECVPEVATRLPPNCNLFVVFKKIVDRPFYVPMQGYYAGQLSGAGRKAWEENR